MLFIDKNHPENAVKPCLKNLEEKLAPFKNIKTRRICVLPLCEKRFYEKGLYGYPYSVSYMLTCLKRVINRPEHLTLEGSEY